MSFETATDPRIRPTVGRQAVAAHGVLDGDAAAEPTVAEGEGFGFADLLDIVNPLQHIPGVSTLYRNLTGDEIKAPARILGGFLYGGPVGFATSVANAIAEEAGGRDLGDSMLALVFGEEESEPALAEAQSAPPPEEAALEPAAGAPQAEDLDQAVPETGPVAAHKAASDAPAVPAVATGTEEPLTGAAALKAFVQDMRRIGADPIETEAPITLPREVQKTENPEPVPANLAGLGLRDKRRDGGAAAIATQPATRPLDRMPQRQQDAKPEGPVETPRRSLAPAGPRVPGPSGIDPTLFTATGSPEPSALTDAQGADLSAQMLDALKKYETMLRQRHGSGN